MVYSLVDGRKIKIALPVLWRKVQVRRTDLVALWQPDELC